jgi:hypothetical protein
LRTRAGVSRDILRIVGIAASRRIVDASPPPFAAVPSEDGESGAEAFTPE